MFIDLIQGFTIIPNKYLETLAVRISVPAKWEIDLKEINTKCGIYKERDDNAVPDTCINRWLTPESKTGNDDDDFMELYLINHKGVAGPHQALRWHYSIYLWQSSNVSKIIPWNLILLEQIDLWSVSIGLAGASNGVTIILPDYNFIEQIHNG